MKSLKICPNYKLQLRIPVFICHSPCVIYVQLFYRSLVVGTMLLPYAEQGFYNLRFFSLKKKCRFVKGKSIVVPLPGLEKWCFFIGWACPDCAGSFLRRVQLFDEIQ